MEGDPHADGTRHFRTSVQTIVIKIYLKSTVIARARGEFRMLTQRGVKKREGNRKNVLAYGVRTSQTDGTQDALDGLSPSGPGSSGTVVPAAGGDPGWVLRQCPLT